MIGPHINNSKKFFSGDFVKKFMMGGYDALGKNKYALVDIKDVASAHLNALKIPEAANKRFILVGDMLWSREIAMALAE